MLLVLTCSAAQASCTPAQAQASAVAAARQDAGRRLASVANLYRGRFGRPAYSVKTGKVVLSGKTATVAGQIFLSGTNLQTGRREQVNFSGLLRLSRASLGVCQWQVTGYRRY